jgi:hypothetical protein
MSKKERIKMINKLNAISKITGGGKNNLLKVAIASSVSAFAIAPVQASNITLDFNTLPSNQGWTYYKTNSTPETNVFSVSNGILTQNTLGTGVWNLNAYTLVNVFDTTQPFILSWRSRVLQDQFFAQNPPSFFGFAVAVSSASQSFGIGFGTKGIGVNENFVALPGTFDNTVFHNYRVEGSFNTGNAQFYIDNVLTTHLVPVNVASIHVPYTLFLGDATGYTNALAEISSYSFRSVPEPLTILGTATALGFGAFFKRKLKSSESSEKETVNVG